jgi:uncharacterized small protein (DUF1192 family)
VKRKNENDFLRECIQSIRQTLEKLAHIAEMQHDRITLLQHQVERLAPRRKEKRNG